MKILKLYPEILLALFTVKCIAFGNISIGDAIAYIGIATFVAYNAYINKTKVSELQTVQKEITDLKNAIQSLKLDKMGGKPLASKPTSWSGNKI